MNDPGMAPEKGLFLCLDVNYRKQFCALKKVKGGRIGMGAGNDKNTCFLHLHIQLDIQLDIQKPFFLK